MSSRFEQSMEIAISAMNDVERAINQTMAMAGKIGLNRTEQCQVGTAVSELATNICRYAEQGRVVLKPIQQQGRVGLEIRVEDTGPGIADLNSAMLDSFSTGNSLGVGLPGTRRMMNEFQIESEPGRGTRICMRKWHGCIDDN